MHLKFSYFVNNEEILNILVNLFIEAETAEGVILLKTQHTFCKEYKQGEIIQAIADAVATSNLLSRRILHRHFQTELNHCANSRIKTRNLSGAWNRKMRGQK